MKQKLTNEEIEELIRVRTAINQLNSQAGDALLKKMALEEEIKILHEKNQIQQQTLELIARQLRAKYGAGTIDFSEGTFTPEVDN